jgi:hypothetical protein
MLDEDSVRLLREINAGCKTATESMEQVLPYVKNHDLSGLIKDYCSRHNTIGLEVHRMLNDNGESEKDPAPTGELFMSLTTELKLMLDKGTDRCAELMADGCSMGIKSVAKYKNKYAKADGQALGLANRLIYTEQEFFTSLLPHL